MRFFSMTAGWNERIWLLLDLGSGSVGGAFVRCGAGAKPEILLSVREPFPVLEKVDTARFLSAMKRALDSVLSSLLASGAKEFGAIMLKTILARRILCVFGSPWYVSRTKIVAVKDAAPMEFSERFLERLLLDEGAALKSELAQKRGAEEFRAIEERIVQAKINGYETARPQGKRGTEIEVVIFISFVPASVAEGVESVLGRRFHLHSAEYHSFALVSALTVRDVFPDEESLLLLSIGGEISDISIIKNGVPIETVSFPLGGNSLLRAVAKAIPNTPLSVAASLVPLFVKGALERTQAERVAAVLAEEGPRWTKLFNEALSLTKEMFLPRNVFLVAPEEYMGVFADLVRRNERGGMTSVAEPPTVVPIGESKAETLAAFSAHAQLDPIFAIEADFLDRVGSRSGGG